MTSIKERERERERERESERERERYCTEPHHRQCDLNVMSVS